MSDPVIETSLALDVSPTSVVAPVAAQVINYVGGNIEDLIYGFSGGPYGLGSANNVPANWIDVDKLEFSADGTSAIVAMNGAEDGYAIRILGTGLVASGLDQYALFSGTVTGFEFVRRESPADDWTVDLSVGDVAGFSDLTLSAAEFNYFLQSYVDVSLGWTMGHALAQLHSAAPLTFYFRTGDILSDMDPVYISGTQFGVSLDVELIEGTAADDVITGGDAGTTIFGFYGRDLISPGLGFDVTSLTASSGGSASRDFVRDVVRGGAGALDGDWIRGLDVRDVIQITGVEALQSWSFTPETGMLSVTYLDKAGATPTVEIRLLDVYTYAELQAGMVEDGVLEIGFVDNLGTAYITARQPVEFWQLMGDATPMLIGSNLDASAVDMIAYEASTAVHVDGEYGLHELRVELTDMAGGLPSDHARARAVIFIDGLEALRIENVFYRDITAMLLAPTAPYYVMQVLGEYDFQIDTSAADGAGFASALPIFAGQFDGGDGSDFFSLETFYPDGSAMFPYHPAAVMDLAEARGPDLFNLGDAGDGSADRVQAPFYVLNGADVEEFGAGDSLLLTQGHAAEDIEISYWGFWFNQLVVAHRVVGSEETIWTYVDLPGAQAGLVYDLQIVEAPIYTGASTTAEAILFQAYEDRGALRVTQGVEGDLEEDVFAPLLAAFESGWSRYSSVTGYQYETYSDDLGWVVFHADNVSGDAFTAGYFMVGGVEWARLAGDLRVSEVQDWLYDAPNAVFGGNFWNHYSVTVDASGVARTAVGDLGLLKAHEIIGSDGDDEIVSNETFWENRAEIRPGATIRAGDGSDLIYADGGDWVDPGANAGFDWIEFGPGDLTVDLASGALNPASWYDLVPASFGGVRGAVRYDLQALTGTIEYTDPILGGADGKSTVTVLNAGTPTPDGGLGLWGSAAADYFSVSLGADAKMVQYVTNGGGDQVQGGNQFDRLWTNVAPTHVIVTSGYAGYGSNGYATNALGDRVVFSGIDEFRGSAGADVFQGGDQDERFIGDGGADVYIGGLGFDTVRYDRSDVDFVYLDLSRNFASVSRNDGADSAVEWLYEIEAVRGSRDGQDMLIGSDAADSLTAYAGIDVLRGGLGADTLRGGMGGSNFGLGGDQIWLGSVQIPLMAGDVVVRMITASDDAPDVVVGTVAELSFDDVYEFGIEDSFLIKGVHLDASQVALDFTSGLPTVLFDEDGDGVMDTSVYMHDDAVTPNSALVAGMAPQLEYVGEDTRITFVQQEAIGEISKLTVGDSWQNITFDRAYDDPIVFALSPSMNELELVATRLRNISSTGAEILLQEPGRIAGVADPRDHVDETVTLLVLERGVHTLSDGTVLEVGTIDTGKLYVQGFEQLSYSDAFDDRPAVFSQVQTFNGTDWVVSRQRNVDAAGFEMTLQEEEFDNLAHMPETVGWLAIETGLGDWGGLAFQAGTSGPIVNGNATFVEFGSWGWNGVAAPYLNVMASLSTYAGSDPVSTRILSVAEDGFTTIAQEDQSKDLETSHGLEAVDWLAVEYGGTLLAMPDAPASAEGPAAALGAEAEGLPAELVFRSGTVSTNQRSVTVDFGEGFDDPVVIASVSSFHGAQSVVAEVTAVGATSFELRVVEPDAYDGFHAWEEISWMVVEAGEWALEDGSVIEAGRHQAGAAASPVVFDADFAAGPAVIAQSMATGYTHARVSAADADGFALMLDGEEGAAAMTGTVGWVAVEAAAGSAMQAGAVSAGSGFASVDFTDAFDFGAPSAFAQIASAHGEDPAVARIRGVDAAGFDVKVEEETAFDAETAHTAETIHWLALEDGAEGWGNALV